MVCKQGSLTKAAEALFLTPQTVTGQIKSLEQRMNGKLTKRNGRTVEPTELGQLVFKYADRMFDLSYEMLDIVNYSQRANLLFEVGVADALSKRLVSQILSTTIPDDGNIHLRCYESTHELLIERLGQHKLDMILSDCPIDSSQNAGLYSKKLGECHMSFYSATKVDEKEFLNNIDKFRLLIPGSRTSMGRKVVEWCDRQGYQPNVFGEFDDVALMKAFADAHPETVFIAPTSYPTKYDILRDFHPILEIESLKEEYFVIFAERMIQHPAVKGVCAADFSDLFH
jgi:LysR family transcriptional activator of nhaA